MIGVVIFLLLVAIVVGLGFWIGAWVEPGSTSAPVPDDRRNCPHEYLEKSKKCARCGGRE